MSTIQIHEPDYTLINSKDLVLSYAQNEIVDFLLKNDYAYNAAQTGLGKTFATITAAIHKMLERPDDDIHFICLLPNPAVKAFSDTIGGLLGLPYNIYTATSVRVQKDAKFSIFNYSSLPNGLLKKNRAGKIIDTGTNKYFETFKQLKREHPNLWLIADEAHVLQDPSTHQYMFVELTRPLYVGMWFLTATPILNDLDGFYHMTQLTHPDFWGNLWRFKNSFQVPQTVERFIYNPKTRRKQLQRNMEVIGYKNLDLLKQQFSKISIVRAKKYELEFIYRSVALNSKTEEYYKAAAEGLFSGTVQPKKTKSKKKSGEAVGHGARMHDLQRVVSNSHKDFHLFSDDELSEKELLLLETILEVINNDEATLVYFSYRETLSRIKQILRKYQTQLNIPTIHEIHGDISTQKRQKVEATIKPRDVVLITSAGTESVNLQKASNLIFYEIPFAIRQFIQACGRITRTNSLFESFKVYILEAEKTIDTYKKNRVVANSEVIRAVLGGSSTLPTELLEITLEDVQFMKDELLWRK